MSRPTVFGVRLNTSVNECALPALRFAVGLMCLLIADSARSQEPLEIPARFVSWCAISPKGTHLAYGTREEQFPDKDTAVVLWDMAAARLVKKIDLGKFEAQGACFSGDGSLLWLGGSTLVKPKGVAALFGSKSSSTLVAGKALLRSWKMDGKPGRTLNAGSDSEASRFLAHSASPDGRFLAAVDDHKMLHVWSATKFTRLARTGSFEAGELSFSDDGEVLAVSPIVYGGGATSDGRHGQFLHVAIGRKMSVGFQSGTADGLVNSTLQDIVLSRNALFAFQHSLAASGSSPLIAVEYKIEKGILGEHSIVLVSSHEAGEYDSILRLGRGKALALPAGFAKSRPRNRNLLKQANANHDFDIVDGRGQVVESLKLPSGVNTVPTPLVVAASADGRLVAFKVKGGINVVALMAADEGRAEGDDARQ